MSFVYSGKEQGPQQTSNNLLSEQWQHPTWLLLTLTRLHIRILQDLRPSSTHGGPCVSSILQQGVPRLDPNTLN